MLYMVFQMFDSVDETLKFGYSNNLHNVLTHCLRHMLSPNLQDTGMQEDFLTHFFFWSGLYCYIRMF